MRALLFFAIALFFFDDAGAEIRCEYNEVEVIESLDRLTHETVVKPGPRIYTTSGVMEPVANEDGLLEWTLSLPNSKGQPIAFLLRVDEKLEHYFHVDLGSGASFATGPLPDVNYDSGLATNFGWKQKFGQQYRCQGPLK